MYRVKVIEKSVSDRALGLSSIEMEYPRCVLAEVVTHRKLYDTSEGYEEWTCHSERTKTRDLSKNSASSRAIPFATMLKKVMDDPYIPDQFSIAGPGMQAAGYMDGADQDIAVGKWLLARDQAVGRALTLLTKDDREKLAESVPEIARCLNYAGVSVHLAGLSRSVHKQDINRLLEPWAWMTQIITGDSEGMANFFALRCHKDAAPAFQKVARMAYLALKRAEPKLLKAGEWHLPYVKPEEKDGLYWWPSKGQPPDTFPDPVVQSIARCAWISYEKQDKAAEMPACRATFNKLMGGEIKHASPCEHQGTPMTEFHEVTMRWARSNLTGWLQARKVLPGESIKSVSFSDEEIASWGIDESLLS